MNKEFRVNLSQLKKRAFTLAETLIVMGIIGVVAALTLPNLNSSTGEKEKVTKVKKIYSNLEDALGRAQAVYGPFDEWCVNYSGSCRSRMFDRVTEFMKTSKVCNTVSSCPDLRYGANGSSCYEGGDRGYTSHSVFLADGTVLGFNNMEKETELHVKFDIDGPNKGPNVEGKDVFSFYFDKNGLIHDNYSGNWYVDTIDDGIFHPTNSAYWIIDFDNMDYLKTSDGTTCPDGKTKLTLGGNHSCK